MSCWKEEKRKHTHTSHCKLFIFSPCCNQVSTCIKTLVTLNEEICLQVQSLEICHYVIPSFITENKESLTSFTHKRVRNKIARIVETEPSSTCCASEEPPYMPVYHACGLVGFLVQKGNTDSTALCVDAFLFTLSFPFTPTWINQWNQVRQWNTIPFLLSINTFSWHGELCHSLRPSFVCFGFHTD